MLKPYQGTGPFVFCDYWATVLGLKSVLNEKLIGSGLVSPEVFKKGLDRPMAKLPKFKYYLLAFILGPGLIPYKVVIDLLVLIRSKSRTRVSTRVDEMLERFKLRARPADEAGRWLIVGPERGPGGEKVVNPARISVAMSLFYPTYKIVIAAVLVLTVTAFAVYALPESPPLPHGLDLYSALAYAFLFGVLVLLFRDLSTAVLAPLPVFALMYVTKISGDPLAFLLASLVVALVFYLVDIFFIPRPMPPALFLYVNDKDSPLFPYSDGHAPYWLSGRCYWVWRFLTLAPAEIHKFWEKDWERLEVWVRADECEEAGQVEWIVTDVHYRELWFRYRRLVPEKQRAEQRENLTRWMSEGDREIVWVTELDMDLLFHTPFLRGLFLTRRTKRGTLEGTIGRLLRAAWVRRVRGNGVKHFREALEELELEKQDFLEDVPEHFRSLALRKLLSLPWTYWRYPLGAGRNLKVKAYDPHGLLSLSQPPAADPHYQIKGGPSAEAG